MSFAVYQRMQHTLDTLSSHGLLRVRKNQSLSSTLVDFSHNDYLGLSTHSKVINAVATGAAKLGVGAKASPLVSGYHDIQATLESKLCQLTGHESALLFCSGFSANTALMQALLTPDDVVIADKLIHASLIDGILHSQAKLKRFAHNDLSHAQVLLTTNSPSVCVTESVFSMDGDKAELNSLKAMCEVSNTLLVVDDAHGFGLAPTKLTDTNAKLADVQVITFGKALGGQGAAILGAKALIDYMVATSRQYIYSTGISPVAALSALAAIEVLESESEHLERLNHNIAYFKQQCAEHKITLMPSDSPIQPLMVGGNEAVMGLSQIISEQGFKVGAIRSPTVPKGQARLRITLNSTHTFEQIASLVSVISHSLQAI